MTLKRKLEIGITRYLNSLSATEQKKYSFHENAVASDFNLPAFVVAATGDSEVVPGCAPKRVMLRVYLATSMHDNEEGEVTSDEVRARVRVQHDAALSAVEAALEDEGVVAALKAYLNSGASKRPVSDFHFYDITKADEQPEMGDAAQYKDALSFEVICQNYDG